MADFTKGSAADMAADNPGINMGTTGSMHEIHWEAVDDDYWRANYASRPYVHADRSYEFYRPAFRYGAHAAAHHGHRPWSDVEAELARGWEAGRGASTSTWDEIKTAARDAWDRVVHREHHSRTE